MERIIIKKIKAFSVSLAVLICLLPGIFTGCDDIPMRSTINDISTKDPEWKFMYKIEAPEGSKNDSFGNSVSISGDYIIIGDMQFDWEYEEVDYPDIGRAYIYKRNGDTWELEETLHPSGIDPTYFGCSVDIWGTQAVSGANYEAGGGTLRGAIYIYELESGTWSEKYHHTSPNNDDKLGYSVCVAEDIAVAGVPDHDQTFSNQGRIDVLIKSEGNWTVPISEVRDDNQAEDKFGRVVDIYDNYIIVSAPGYDSEAGKVYLYEYDGVEVTEITLPLFTESLVAGNHLGQSVSIFNDSIFAGAPDVNPFTAVYLRQGDDWNKDTLPAGGEGFASAVGVSDEFAVIGSPNENDNTGEICFYKWTGSTWTQYGNPVTANDGETDNYFGCAVAISSEYCVIGAEGANNEGAVYIYKYIVYETPE